MGHFDVTYVLSGGVREGGALPPWTIARLDLALEVNGGEKIMVSSAGTTHRPPPLDPAGFPITESAAGAQYLLSKGFPADRLELETSSYDTIGNGYFSKVAHVDPAEWRRIRVITSEFHMPRSQAVFEWVYGMGPHAYSLEFLASPDAGEPDGLVVRRERERENLAKFLILRGRVTTMPELHEWLFREHGAHRVDGVRAGDRTTDPVVLSSY